MTQTEIDFFDSLAPSWDDKEIRSTPERVKEILCKLPISNGMDVLDLGTGTGVLVPYLSELVGAAGNVVGIDFSEGMLTIARKKYGSLNNVKFLKLDFEEELIPGKYDIALLYSVYPHLHAPAATIEWLFKMNLKHDGIIVIAFPSDEKFINGIHHESKADHDHLPSAHVLSEMIGKWGYSTEVIAANADEYIVTVRNK